MTYWFTPLDGERRPRAGGKGRVLGACFALLTWGSWVSPAVAVAEVLAPAASTPRGDAASSAPREEPPQPQSKEEHQPPALQQPALQPGSGPFPLENPAPSAEPVCVVLQNTAPEVPDENFWLALGQVFAPAPVLRGCPTSADPVGRLSIVFAPAERELTVTFAPPHGAEITRVVQAPELLGEAPEMSALVALELTRRQTVAGLAPEQTPSPEAVEPSPELVASQLALAAEIQNNVSPAPVAETPREFRIANAAFFYPLAVNFDAPNIKTALDFNLLYGVVGEVEGLQVGAFNDVRGPMQGLQVGWFVSGNEGPLRGASLAGLFASSGGINVGLQAAGLITLSNGSTRGLQASFGGNLSRQDLRGVQVSGLLNVASGGSQGIQATLGANIAKHLTGLQVSPLLNYARDVTGLQVGLVNVGRKVRGSQIGLVNIAQDVEGMPIGLVSVAKTGGVHLSTWVSNTTLVNLGIRLATRYTYSMFTLGYHRSNDVDALGPGFIMGARIPVQDQVAVDVDVGGEYLLGTRLCCYEDSGEEQAAHGRDRSFYRLRVVPTWQPHPSFSVFAGGGLALKVPFAVYAGMDKGDRTVTLGPEVLFGVSL